VPSASIEFSRISPRLAFGQAPSVYGQNDALRAEALGQLAQQLGPRDGRGVHGDFVRACAQQGVHVIGAAHAAAHGQWDEDLVGGASHDLQDGAASFFRRRHIQKSQLICTFSVIPSREFYGVTGIAESLEVYALDYPSFFDVQARDDSSGDAQLMPPRSRIS